MTSRRLFTANLAVFAASLAAAFPPGPAVGQKAFDFQLKDQKGVERSLASVLGPKGGLLVFYRSCDW